MSVFTRFAIRSLKRNRTRTAVSIIGIALSCALITAVFTSVVSMTTMLRERTAADEGTWQVEAIGLNEEGLETIAADGRIDRHIEVVELGSVSMGEENAKSYGPYQFIKTWPQNPDGENIVTMQKITDGHAPQAAGEVVLPHYLQGATLQPCGIATEGALDIGSHLSVQLGTRTITTSDGTYVSLSSSSIGGVDEEISDSYEANLGTLDLTVVGFYYAYGLRSTSAMEGTCFFVYPESGCVEKAATDGAEATCVYSLITVHNPHDADPLAQELANSSQATGGASTHNSLLRWQGATNDADIWTTLYMMAGILAAVIIVAGISLVYNAFAISVSERTQMFGLLASLGASKRQLRRTVLTEALILSAIGIPAGIVLGILGCVAVFALTGSGLAYMFNVDAYGVAAQVTVSLPLLALAALLSLATVLVSAWIPARRASRVSAVDAIRRTQDVRLTRSARRRLARSSMSRARHTRMDARPHGVAARLFGIPGFIAHRNLTRAASKARVTIAALAVSVTLLIVAGLIGGVLDYATTTSVNTANGVDLEVSVFPTTREGEQGALIDAEGDIDSTRMLDAVDDLYAAANSAVDATPLGYSISYYADTLIPASMVSGDANRFFGTQLNDGSWAAPIYIYFVDDTTWRAYIDELGLSTRQFCSASHPEAIALNRYNGQEDGNYVSYSPLANTGSVRVVTFKEDENLMPGGIVDNDQGEPSVWYSGPDGAERYVPVEEAVESDSAIEVGAMADSAPAGIDTFSSTLSLVMPASAISLARTLGNGSSTIAYATGGSAEAAGKAQDTFEGLASTFPDLSFSFNNIAQTVQQNRLMSQTVQTFIYCFTVICGLIAIANVFNTLTNSLILRRREFAVLKSIGMGDRAFGYMIAYECASYALRGLAVGAVLSAVVALLLTRAMELSYISYELEVPWANVGISILMILVIILISVAYALHQCRASSVVEALKTDIA